ncbi:NAD(P)-dependent oxidoreductase [Streptomyces oceani]|uniref:Epimerase n=1 Tax=Streptomyces oceani TaxID=1075402 RepID=A0A1E7KHT3_9ACTN|nr:NAD(P)H-binding protein [Streptomyces oceani]OEV03445.1 epimerase [Streptomyces oceani]
MRLTVLGASGGTGQQLVRQALEHGHQVTAVLRDPARLPLEHEQLTLSTSDMTDPDALRDVVAGRDAVLSALGASGNKQAAALPIASTGIRAALTAMDATGVRRLVAVSAAPVGPTPRSETLTGRVLFRTLRRVFHGVYADLARMEEELRDSSTEWTVLRPPRLLDKPLTGRYARVPGGAVPRRHQISRADLAHAMLATLDDSGTVRKVLGVAS